MNAPESSLALPLTPQERLVHIQNFLFTTNYIRTSRVFYAEILAPLVDAETLESTRRQILEDTDENIGEANRALTELQHDSRMRLHVQHPLTGEIAMLNFLGITPNKLTFMGKVSLGNEVTVWDIGAVPSLSLQ